MVLQVLANLLLPAAANASDISTRERVSCLAARVAGCMLSAGGDPAVARGAVTAVCSHVLELWQPKASEQAAAKLSPRTLGRDGKYSSLNLIYRLQQEVQSHG